MNEKPLERLNFYNGQRLQAADYRLEQEYHMRVRRWLNRSLFRAGIAEGLYVVKVPGAPKVRVSPGLALDAMGREIILLEEREECVPGAHDEKNLPVGLYLTIRYAEETFSWQDAACALGSGSRDKAPSGGPARVRTGPVFEWSDKLPSEGSGKVLLAFVGLGQGCKEVSLLDLGVRDNVGIESATTVRQYALEGFRDVGELTPGRIYFHIRGRQPRSVTLFLRAARFPEYFYTELGNHEHTLSSKKVSTLPPDNSSVGSHSHAAGGLTGVAHTHHFHTNVWGWLSGDNNNRALLLYDRVQGGIVGFIEDLFGDRSEAAYGNIVNAINARIDAGSHAVTGRTGEESISYSHTHDVHGVTNSTGADDLHASAGKALAYVDTLQIRIDGQVCTGEVLRQVNSALPAGQQWPSLSANTDGDPFVSKGTGAIRLDYFVNLTPDEHVIELSVEGKRNGGRIYYNLYVE